MIQYLQTFVDSNLGRKILATLGLPEPVPLDRYHSSQTSFLQGNVLVGSAPGGQLLGPVCDVIAQSEAKIFFPADSSNRLEMENELTDLFQQITPYQGETTQDLRFKALVFDASGIESSEQLRALYEFFHPLMRRLAHCARVVVLGRQPQVGDDVKLATARRALEGFIRSVGKEVGKKGATAQLVYVETGAENQLQAPLRFLLSPKSAYVSAQVLRISRAKETSRKKSSSIDWQLPLAGKVALVTGASRGIGEKIAQVLARDGARVVGLDIKTAEHDLRRVMNGIDGSALCMDITEEQAPGAIAAWLKKECNGVDIVVHNAGVTRDKTLAGMPGHLWDLVLDVNLCAEERINQALLEHKTIKKGGRIICVSSLSGIAGNFGQTNYGTSKAGVIGMVQAMAPILAKQGITINAVAPGFIETQMTEAMPFVVREVAKRINALGQPGIPQDVAETIAFYANPLANGVTGNVLRVCGQNMLGA